MKIELHLLQNFAPSNLNRDDTGAPKDCEFGGTRRARISSQCLKRAIRNAFEVGGHFAPDELAARTKRLLAKIGERLVEHHGKTHDQAVALTQAAIEGAGLGLKEGKTQYLLFLPRRSIHELAAFVDRHWDALVATAEQSSSDAAVAAAAAAADGDDDGGKKKKKKSGKAGKKKAQEGFPAELGKELLSILADTSKTPDLALFGRMIADNAGWNVDAACQVAHAISTNKVTMDFDFYTAVDDFKPDDSSASGMMGTVQLNSSCFYRYEVVDLEELSKNLSADPALTRRTLEAFLRASITAIPTGKQNSTAAQNPPSYILAVVRRRGMPVSLANAFIDPARPRDGADLVTRSVVQLEEYFGNLCRMYGTEDVTAALACADRELTGAADGVITRVSSVAELVAGALQHVEA